MNVPDVTLACEDCELPRVGVVELYLKRNHFNLRAMTLFLNKSLHVRRSHLSKQSKLPAGRQHARQIFVQKVHQLAVVAPHEFSHGFGEERSFIKGLEGGAEQQTKSIRHILHHYWSALKRTTKRCYIKSPGMMGKTPLKKLTSTSMLGMVTTSDSSPTDILSSKKYWRYSR